MLPCFQEVYHGPYIDGLDVEGYNTGLGSYASLPRLIPDKLLGDWKVTKQHIYQLSKLHNITCMGSGDLSNGRYVLIWYQVAYSS